MATKAKTLQVKDKEKDDKAADAPEKDSPDAPSPLLDLSDAAVKKMIKQAKKRGFVTFDQLNEVLPSDMGINVSEAEDSDSDEETKEEAEGETDNELVEVTQKAVTEVKKSEPGERTDDPVRMYLREMGTVELLSREGEIAIAKRIYAGPDAKNNLNPALLAVPLGPDGQPLVAAAGGNGEAMPAAAAPPAAPPSATPFRAEPAGEPEPGSEEK